MIYLILKRNILPKGRNHFSEFADHFAFEINELNKVYIPLLCIRPE